METTTCKQCGKPIAPGGGNAQCACEEISGASEDAEDATSAYDLAPAPAGQVRSSPRQAKVDEAPNRVLAYRTAPSGPAPRADTETIKNLYMPLWLLGGGSVVQIVAALLTEQHGLLPALAAITIQIFLGTTLTLLGILVAAKLRAIDFGALGYAVLKLTAISVAPAALVAVLAPILKYIPFGSLIGWAAEFILYFTLLGALFDLDESDTWYCVAIIFLVHIGVYFLLIGAAAWF